jgi:imidazolonepropionase-like amidohydrolase
VQAAGTLLLRHEQWPFTPTPPEHLRRAALDQVARGARWVKIFSDWSSDYSGRENTGFSGQDELTYPPAVLGETVAAVHAAGGRVAAHCFTHAGAAVAIDAGADSLEHGWGVDDPLLAVMAQRHIAWVPLLGIAVPMRAAAARFGESQRTAWIDERMAALHRLLPEAHRQGVPLLTGTDWHPEVTVAHEIRELYRCGVPRTAALAAGTWGARAFLGEPGIEDGAPADLLIVRDDPRDRLDALLTPEAIVIGGEPVPPDLGLLQRDRQSWSPPPQPNQAPPSM